jgi:hypothetical protein
MHSQCTSCFLLYNEFLQHSVLGQQQAMTGLHHIQVLLEVNLLISGLISNPQFLFLKGCEVRDLNPRSRAWEARTLTMLG